MSNHLLTRRHSLLGLAALLAGAAAPAAAGTALRPGQPAPRLQLTDLDGRVWDTAALRGQVVVLAFWASWCPPCRQELPLLSHWAAAHRGRLQVLGVSLDGADQLPALARIAATLDFPVARLGSAWAGGYGRIWRLPVSFVIDAAGNLADDGWSDADPVWTEGRLHQVLDPLLKG